MEFLNGCHTHTHTAKCTVANTETCPCRLPQIPLLAEGVRIHGEKATEQLKPLHNRLLTCFHDLREKVEKHYGVITLVGRQPQTQFNGGGCQL